MIEEPDGVVADEVDVDDFVPDAQDDGRDDGVVGQLELELDDLGSERRS